MADSVMRVRRAVKEHRCTERTYHTIRPGDLYLYAACPPWHEVNDSRKWWVIKACLRCANEFCLHNSDTRKQLDNLQGVERSAPQLTSPRA